MGILRFLVRYGYAPLFFIGFIGAAVWMVANGASKIWLAGLLLPAIALSFIAERIAPFEENWNHSKGDTTRDTLHAVINELTNAASIAAIPILAAMTHGFDVWPGEWPLWAQLVMTILIADFGITMAHYASHKIEALWRLHAVHHSVERMYGFNGLMKHPLHQAIELTAGTTPLLLMGMPLEIGALLGFAAAIQLLLQHSNTDMRVGPLHLAHKVKGDVNFGLFTMLWDHLLGTFVKDRPQPRDGELGVAGRPDYPVGYSAQLVEPFRRWDRSKNTQLAE